MYSLIIVDDEEEIRNGLTELMNWSEMGFQVAGSFEDGDEAIEYIKSNRVDVVLTDICMAEVSGLEIAEFIHKEFPKTVVVIISGYKEFEYAKKAIAYNVRHYMIKPTEVAEIQDIFRNIKLELDKRNQEEKAIINERERYLGLVSFLSEQFFADLVMGALRDSEELKKRLGLIYPEIDPEVSNCWLIEVAINNYEKYLEQNWEYGRTGLDTAMNNFFRGFIGDFRLFKVMSVCDEFKVVAVYNGKYDEKAIIEQLDILADSILEVLKVEIVFKNLKSFTNLYELANYNYPINLSQEYQAIEQNINRQVLTDSSKIVLDKLKMIVSNICEGNIESVESLFDSLMGSMEKMPIELIRQSMSDLFALLFNKLNSMGIETNIIEYKSVLEMEDLSDIQSYSKKVFADVIKYINDNGNGKNSSIYKLVERAKEYVQNNYSKDLSMDYVADKMFLNSVYFSRMFKQITGENFTDYLNDVRLQNAIELMKKRRYKIHEIGEKVGYNSYRYFCMVFKKYTGLPPKEYCRNILGEG